MPKSIFVFLLFFSIEIKAQLIYTNFVPDVSINSSLIDTTINFFPDLNQDNIGDFKFESKSWFTTMHQGCCWNYISSVFAIDTSSKIAFRDTNNINNFACTTALLDSGEYIDNRFTWVNWVAFAGSGPGALIYCSIPNIIKFLPVKIMISGFYHYGWIRIYSNNSLITFYDMELNSIPNQGIYTHSYITGLNEQNKVDQLSVYPNPSNGAVDILIPQGFLSDNQSIVYIYNSAGRLVLSSCLDKNLKRTRLNLLGEAKGLYIVILNNGKKNLKTTFVLD